MKFRLLAMLCITCAVLLVASCSSDEKDCPECPAQKTPPAITALTATPEMVDQGGHVAVSATAEGAGLTYAWTASGGTFASANQASTTWTAPNAPGVHLLTVTVTKEGLSSNRSKAVGVEMSLQLTASDSSVVIGHPVVFVARAVGQDLIYDWTATGGTFTKTDEDSAWWKAPDAVPTANPEVRVVVAQPGQDARIEEFPVTILAYTATAEPHYVGATTCNVAACHGGTHLLAYTSWSHSLHSQAYEALAAIGMNGNAECLECHTVGAKGLNVDASADNGGWDDIPIAARSDVQCENCHGAASGHPANGALPKPLNASLCGSCHTDAHHPTYDEWQESAHHGLVLEEPIESSPIYNKSCAKCHNGIEALKYLNSPTTYQAPAENLAVTDSVAIVCVACHDPHGSGFPGSLRLASQTDVVLPDGSEIAEAGAGRLCMACHNGRRTPTNIQGQVDNGTAHFGPHHSCQGEMLAGTGAYEGVVQDTTQWASSRHLLIQDGCVNCHTHAHEGDPENGIPNFTGHDFHPQIKACQPCHGNVPDFEHVMAGDDYDGDGEIEGVQLEIDGLLAALKQAVIDASDTPEHQAALEEDFAAAFDHAAPDLVTTVDQRKAGYNYFFVVNDGSRGVHNARYAAQLLQRSIALLQPLPKGMAVVVD